MAGNDEIKLDVVALTDELKTQIQTSDFTKSSKHCIFRIPDILSHHSPRAYEPNAFSIGPYHHHKPHLQATEDIKLMYLQSLVSRHLDPDAMLKCLMEGICEDLRSYHDCYQGPIDMNMEELLKVLVIDGCFLVELLFRKVSVQFQKAHDPILAVSCMSECLHHDLILLENQIPWGVLVRVCEMTLDCTRLQAETWLVKFVIVFFHESSATTMSTEPEPEWLSQLRQSKHILDLLRSTMVLPFPNKKSGVSWQTIPTATTLTEAGIRFKPIDSSESILGINFVDGVLEIPHLQVNETTEPLFRNIISFEQCLPFCDSVVTSYAILMDNLINTAEDMEVLCKSGAVKNWLSNEDATKFFNQLYNDTYVTGFHYCILSESINKYRRRRMPGYMRVLMHHYLNHPWAIISVIAGITLLVLTFLQTFFTIKN